jgi:two-component system, OmpR family, response regulator PhoP
MRLLVVEDEPDLRTQLRDRLVGAGFNVDVAADGEEGLYCAREYPIDLAIVDLGLPKRSGLELVRDLRRAGRTVPVLILTARDRWQDKVEALQGGADDYVTKPFEFEELLARVQALLRRSAGWASPRLQCGPVVLDTREQRVSVRGSAVELTTYEYRLLEHMMLRAGEVLSNGELTDRLYENDSERDSNTIEVFIGRLRKKLDPDETLNPIETLRGRGYRLALPRESA